MQLFETYYRQEWDTFVRVFNTDTNKSESFQIPNKWEYFKPISNGLYTCITDKNLKLTKYLGTKKEADGNFGVRSPIEHYIRDHFWSTKSFNMNPRIFYLDIETRSGQNSDGFPEPSTALEQVTLIQIFDNVTNSMIVLGLRDFIDHYNKLSELEYPVKYIKCSDEVNLFENFFKIFKALNPLIIYAWNGVNFDFQYLYNRAKNLGLDPNNLSNYGNVSVEVRTDENGEQRITFKSSGHFFIDMIEVYKAIKITNQPSYTLEYISQIELGQGKVDHDEFTSFDSFYTGKDYSISDKPYDDNVREEIRQLKILESKGIITDEQSKRLTEMLQFRFVYYGVKDVYLLKLLDKKKNLTNIICSKSSTMGVNFSESIGTLKPWGSYILNEFYKKRMVQAPKSENDGLTNIIGGFVRDPIVGQHKWIVSEDVNSMYPLLSMVSFNMSPETFIPVSKAPPEVREMILTHYNDQNEDRLFDLSNDVKLKTSDILKKYKLSMGINGALFSNEETGLIPQLVLDIYLGRKKDKKTMLKYDRAYELLKETLKSCNNTVNVSELKDPLEYLDNHELLKDLSKDNISELMKISESN